MSVTTTILTLTAPLAIYDRRYAFTTQNAAGDALTTGTTQAQSVELFYINSTGVGFTCSAAPTIHDGYQGQYARIFNGSANTWSIQDQGTLAGSNMRLSSTFIAIAPRQSIAIYYVGTDWFQVGDICKVI